MTGRDFTLGVEQEFQLIDPETRELRPAIEAVCAACGVGDGIELQQELHRGMVEVATPICADVTQLRAEVVRTRRAVAQVAERAGLRIAAAGTHPTADWRQQPITAAERYESILGELQDLARANLVWGLHVHVGIPDRELAMAVFNDARVFLPHFLALSASSPFFDGRDTQLHSARTSIFQRIPRTGIPPEFASRAEFDALVATMVRCGSIDDARRLWWDLRPHPVYPTLEFRVCDMPTRIDDVVTIAALVQAVVAKLAWLHERKLSLSSHHPSLIGENKWRAARHGCTGSFLDLGRERQVPFPRLCEQLLAFVDDVVDDLGSRHEVEGVWSIMRRGTSSQRQREVFAQSGGDFSAVVDAVLADTADGLAEPAAAPRRHAPARLTWLREGDQLDFTDATSRALAIQDTAAWVRPPKVTSAPT